jgi:putative transposase
MADWAKPGSGGKKVGNTPTDRGKKGTKQSLAVDRDGGPLGVVIAAANVNDHLLLEATLAAVVVERPTPTAKQPQHLCLDADYDNPASREVVARHDYTPHICPRNKGKRRRRRGRARRWVVERTLAWLSKCRGLLVRYDKHAVNYLGLLQLACGLLWYRRLHRLQSG